jgi:tryptophan-rich sensory protein
MSPRTRDIGVLAAFIVICLLASALGAAVTVSASGSWYDSLAKAAWNPPPGVFGPVWTVLYVMMGVAAWLVWRTGPSHARRHAMTAFGVQLTLNVLWSYLFFGFHLPLVAVIEMAALWLAIAATIAMFARLSRTAAWLLVPYILWVSYALTLNGAIVALN